MNKKLITCIIISFFTSYVSAANTNESQPVQSVPSSVINKIIAKNTKKQLKSTANKNITLNFGNISVRQLLQVLANFSDKNFVINNSVKGNMSIHLKNVSWDNALNVVLRSQQLGQIPIGNTVLIAPLSEITTTQIAELKAKMQMDQSSPLVDKVIFLKYANAETLAKTVSSKGGTQDSAAVTGVLSPRGEAKYNTRTNAIWLRDTPLNVSQATKIIHDLDIPVRQVEIDARIITIDKEFEKELGSRLGITNPYMTTGSLTGANALRTIRPGTVQKSIADQYYTPGTNLDLNNRLNFDNAAGGTLFQSATSHNPGQIAFSLLKIGHNLLDFELSALEGEKHAINLANPRIVTLDNQEAVIKQGSEIPFAVTSPGGGTSIQTKKAELELKVTPQITPDNRVVLNLTVNNNSIGDDVNTGGTEKAKSITTEEEKSDILLNNNETIVIGGIYKQIKTNIDVGIPYLSKIPLLGALFRFKDHQNFRDELLIFVTPHIVNKPSELTPGFLEHGSL